MSSGWAAKAHSCALLWAGQPSPGEDARVPSGQGLAVAGVWLCHRGDRNQWSEGEGGTRDPATLISVTWGGRDEAPEWGREFWWRFETRLLGAAEPGCGVWMAGQPRWVGWSRAQLVLRAPAAESRAGVSEVQALHLRSRGRAGVGQDVVPSAVLLSCPAPHSHAPRLGRDVALSAGGGAGTMS